jgi:tetratricopeptide (TPR) repeat protein
VSDQSPKGKFREDEQSDLFSVKPYTTGASIPALTKVPKTKEELRKQLLLRITYVVLALLAISLAVGTTLHFRNRAAVEAAVQAASDDGRVVTIREAMGMVGLDDDPESRAILLRLRAMLVLAGVDDDTEAIGAALRELPMEEGEDVARERWVAETYLALARGDLAAAREHASQIVSRGTYAPEAARARALAAWSVGLGDQALEAARAAAEQRPEAPRHVALYAELMARAGQIEPALARLDELPADRQGPATRIARARIMDRGGAALEAMATHAQSVLDHNDATPHERAWARLILARAAAAAGDRPAAREHLDQADEVAPVGDELFTLALAEAALRIDADVLARQVAERLPAPLSMDAPRRAQLRAELALAANDLRAAESALEHAPAGGRTALARGRLLEARGRVDEARQQYLEATGEPALRVPATVQLAMLELGQGSAQVAADRIAPLLAEHANHPDVVPVAVEAQLGLGQRERAMELVQPALEAHPRDIRLLAARAHVQMALAQWEEALATIDDALRYQADEADLHADRGRAARQLSRLDVARQAFDAALALVPAHPVALVGRLELDVMAARTDEGQEILERIDRAEMTSLTIERLRARLSTMRVAGQAAVDALRRALTRHPDDELLVMSLGWLYMQAEQYSNAARTFARLGEGRPAPVPATLARCLALVRMRASAPAKVIMENLVESLGDRSTLEPAVRAELHAVLGRLAIHDDQRLAAQREVQEALRHDPQNGEAHLILSELAPEGDPSGDRALEAALRGPHPSSRPLALLAMRADPVTPAACAYANRYRAAAPEGAYVRGMARVLRDCRRQGE